MNLFKKEDQKYNLISYINEDDDLTLREVLLDRLNFSVRYASKLKRFKTVTVNKNFKKLDKKVKKGDLIEVEIKEDMANFTPQDLNLNIIYDDFDLIMVDKPPFMVVHPTKSHFENTMANGVTDYIIKKGEDVISLYNTPYGMMNINISTKELDIDMDEDGGVIYTKYVLGLEGQPGITTELKVKIRAN